MTLAEAGRKALTPGKDTPTPGPVRFHPMRDRISYHHHCGACVWGRLDSVAIAALVLAGNGTVPAPDDTVLRELVLDIGVTQAFAVLAM
jgi:hypothetical protein